MQGVLGLPGRKQILTVVGASSLPRACLRASVSRRAMSTEPFHRPLTIFSEDTEMLRQTVRKFALNDIKPHVEESDKVGKFHESIVPGLFAQGFMGIEIPPEYEGAGMAFTDSLIVIEEISRIDPSVSAMVDIHNTLINHLTKSFGTEEQKKKYLPRLAQDTVGAFCLSESDSGSDAFSLQTRAIASADGSSYTINGVKQWISNSQDAGVFIVFATVDPSKKYKGITAFIVEKDNPGIRVGNKYDKLGLRSSSTCEVILEDCKVDASCILGKVGEGYKLAIESLNEGRIGIAAQMIGLAQGAWDIALPYIHERKQFGQTIADFQGMRFQYAELRTQLEAAKLLVYNAAALCESGKPFATEAAMAKLTAGRVAEKMASQCVEFLGGYGFTREFAVEKFYRDAKIGGIYEGTVNMQLETISKAIQREYKGSA